VYEFVERFLSRHVGEEARGDDPASHPSVSMHVRHGDACHVRRKKKNERETTERGWYGLGGRPCYEPEVYMAELERLRTMYGVRRVYLATDSSDMLRMVQQDKKYEWVYLNASRDALKVDSGGTFIEQRLPFLKEDVHKNTHGGPFSIQELELVSLGAASDVVLMSQGDIFIGTSGSVFSRVGYYAMLGEQGTIVPFSSVDGIPFCCNGISNCAVEAMHKRGQKTIASCIHFA
jgi:hypothetical protein